MFRAFIIWLMLGLATTGLSAPLLDLTALSQDTTLLGPYTGTLEDSNRTIDPLSASSQALSFSASPIKHFSYTASRIWTRIEVINPGPTTLLRILEVDLPGITESRWSRDSLSSCRPITAWLGRSCIIIPSCTSASRLMHTKSGTLALITTMR